MPKEEIVKTEEATRRLPWIFILLGVLSFLVVLYFIWFIVTEAIFFDEKNNPTSFQKVKIHYYDNPKTGLDKILVRVFVFKPKDDDMIIPKDWRIDLDTVFSYVKATHEDQFLGFSDLQFVIYPEIIIGEHDKKYYDQELLSIKKNQDENQLNLIMSEINDRIQNNELNKISFAPFKHDYLANQIVYTGGNETKDLNGMPAGYTNDIENKNSSIVFMKALKDIEEKQRLLVEINEGQYNKNSDLSKEVQATLFYHEILHTLGVPEGYDYENFLPHEDDIMGAGVPRIISLNYISKKTKKRMGL